MQNFLLWVLENRLPLFDRVTQFDPRRCQHSRGQTVEIYSPCEVVAVRKAPSDPVSFNTQREVVAIHKAPSVPELCLIPVVRWKCLSILCQCILKKVPNHPNFPDELAGAFQEKERAGEAISPNVI